MTDHQSDPYDFSDDQHNDDDILPGLKPHKRIKITKETNNQKAVKVETVESRIQPVKSGSKDNGNQSLILTKILQSSQGDVVTDSKDTALKGHVIWNTTPESHLGTDTSLQSRGMCTVGVETEPAYLGPCEPGTSVTLEGIVWHESDTGILVINVTWRGKKYIGTLLDSSRHEWAPPNPNTANNSTKEKTPVKVRGRKGRGGKKVVPPPPHCSPRKWSSSTPTSQEQLSNTDQSKTEDDEKQTCEVILTCTETTCNKKFRGVNCKDALEYHKIHAHAPIKSDTANVNAIKTDTANVKPAEPAKQVNKVMSTMTDKCDNKAVETSDKKTSDKTIVDTKQGIVPFSMNQTDNKPIVPFSMNQTDNKPIVPFMNQTDNKPIVPFSMNQTDTKPIEFTSNRTSSSIASLTKKVNTPIAVLRPLVPQQATTQDGRIPNISTVRSQSINRQPTNVSSVRPMLQAYNGGPSYHGVFPGATGADSRRVNRAFHPSSNIHSAAPIPSERPQGGRNSLTYSDISDASDQEGESERHDMQSHPPQGHPPSIEDRLFCNEELISNSPPPSSTNNNAAVSQVNTTLSNASVKSNSNSTSSSEPAIGSTSNMAPPSHVLTPAIGSTSNMAPPSHVLTPAIGSTSNMAPPSHVLTPAIGSTSNMTPPSHVLTTTQPQPLVYPYLPFIQTTQMQGNLRFPPSQPGPIYAAPYLMTYAGMSPYMPSGQPIGATVQQSTTNLQMNARTHAQTQHNPTTSKHN